MTVKRWIITLLLLWVITDAMGPQITRRAVPAVAWLWLGGAVLIVGAFGLALWHHRRMTELRAQWLISEDWERVPGWRRDDRWVCPRCGSECPSLAHAERHLDPESSPCAAFQLDREQREVVPAAAPGEGWPAVAPPDGDEE